jgi:hypothetical protein
MRTRLTQALQLEYSSLRVGSSVRFMSAQRKRGGSQEDGGIIFRLTEEIVSESREHRRIKIELRENCS